MIGLIRKDFYLNRKTILIFGVTALAYAVMMIIAGFFMRSMESPINVSYFSMINTLLFFMCALGVQSIMAQTDMGKKTRYYFCASPACIRGFVAGKFYESFLIGFITFLYCEVYDLILSMVFGTVVNTSLIHVAILFFVMVIQSINLPLFIGFGRHGEHLKTVIILVFFICAAIYGLFGDISFFMKEDGVIALFRNMMEHADNESLMAWILGAAYPVMIFLFLLPHLLILLIYLSYRISCALFRRGAMSYEA